MPDKAKFTLFAFYAIIAGTYSWLNLSMGGEPGIEKVLHATKAMQAFEV